MYCDYCGQQNQDSAYRCARCRTRLDPSPVQTATREPVITTSAIPNLAPVAAPAPAPKLRAHSGGGSALPADARPTRQSGLFQGDSRGVAQMEAYAPIRSRTRAPEAFAELKRGKPTAAKRVSDLQAAFDFAAPIPNSALKRATEFDGNRAPWPILLAGTLTDTAVVAVFTVAAALVARQVLISSGGVIPSSQTYLPVLAATAVLIALIYKALWAMFGQETPGLQGVRLELVGFNHRRPSFAQRMIRVLVGWLGFATVGLGVVYSIVDRNGLCWHDHASQSYNRLSAPPAN